MYVESGGASINAIIESKGYQTVYGSGATVGTIVSSGGFVALYGTASGSQIMGGEWVERRHI